MNLFDYYFHPHANDLAAEDEPALPPEYIHWRRAANAMDLLDLENGVVPWTASRWQRDLYPPEYRDDFVVIPDGIDTDLIPDRRPGPRPRSDRRAGDPGRREGRHLRRPAARYLRRSTGS